MDVQLDMLDAGREPDPGPVRVSELRRYRDRVIRQAIRTVATAERLQRLGWNLRYLERGMVVANVQRPPRQIADDVMTAGLPNPEITVWREGNGTPAVVRGSRIVMLER